MARILAFPLLYLKQLIYLNTPNPTHEVKEVPEIQVGVASTAFPNGSVVTHLNKSVDEAMKVIETWRKVNK